MTTTDYIVLVLYLALTVVIGIALSVRNKSAADMFAAGRQSPWWAAGLSGFMTMFSAATFTVWGGLAFEHGAVAVAINLCYGVSALLAGYHLAGRWRKLGIENPAQFIELRYGRGALYFFTWSMMIFRMFGMGIALYSLAIMLIDQMPLAPGNPLRDPATGKMSLEWAIVIFGFTVLIYTIIGGLWGVLMTDVLQFIILNIAVLFVVPLAISQAGGWASIRASAPAEFFSPVNNDYTWFFLAGWTAIHYFTIGAEWAFVQRFLCVPTERDAKKGAYLFGALYLISPFIWMLPPMVLGITDPMPAEMDGAARHAYAEGAYIRACEAVLPTGMMGLMLAAMFSATSSGISGQLNVFAGVLTNDIFGALSKHAPRESTLVFMGRLFTAMLGLAIIGIALVVPLMGGARDVVIAASSLVVGPLLAPTIWGLCHRGVTQSAVWWTAGVCIVAGAIVKFGIAGGGWFPQIGVLQDASQWVQSHTPTVDVLLGVVLPVVTLCIVAAFSRGTAAGWQRIASLPRQEPELLPEASRRAPARLIGQSLLGCGSMTAVLAFLNSGDDRWILLGFAFGLLLLGTVILVAVRRPFATVASREISYVET